MVEELRHLEELAQMVVLVQKVVAAQMLMAVVRTSVAAVVVVEACRIRGLEEEQIETGASAVEARTAVECRPAKKLQIVATAVESE